MIWYEIDGGPLEVPTGGDTVSSSSSRSQERHGQEMATYGRYTDGAIVASQTRSHDTSEAVMATQNFSEEVNAGTQRQTVEQTGQTEGSGSFATLIDDGSGNAENNYFQYESLSHTSSAEHGRTVNVVATDGAVHRTVEYSRTFWMSWSSSVSESGATTHTHVSSNGATVTETSTTATSYTTGGTSSTVITGSTTESRAGPGSWNAQTTTTGTCVHYGTTTATETRITSCWTIVDDVPTTTLVSTTAITTATTDYTVTAKFTTTMTDIVPAGHKRKTVMIADCGYKLLVAKWRDVPGYAHAEEWYEDKGTLAILDPLEQTVYTATTLSTTQSSSVTWTDINTTEMGLWGRTVLDSSTEANHMAGHTVQNGGAVIIGGGVHPVGYHNANSFLYFPTFGESGPITLRATGLCILHVTINPGYGHGVSYSTLTAGDGVAASWTFRAGCDVKVDGCLAFAPAEYAAPVVEVRCRDAPLRACG